MQHHERDFEALGTTIVVVTFDNAADAREYVAETGITWPILIDRERALYHAYGMDRGRRRDIWGLRTWWAYAKELARGRVPRPAHSDTLQLGGDVLIDPEGVVRFHHVGSGPADRPSVSTLLDARQGSPPNGAP